MRLTDRLVKSLPTPVRPNAITYCSELKGFGCRVNKSGARAFILNYRFEGRERRITIGTFPEWSVAAARERASELRRQIDVGIDPLTKREDRIAAPTVTDLFQRYEREHLPRKAARSAADDRSMWTKIILPKLGRLKVVDLTFSDVERLHSSVSIDRPTRANRVLEVLRKALNLAIKWDWISSNPAIGLSKNQEQPRHRYVTEEELRWVMQALDEHSEKLSTDAIQLLIMSGARKSEVLQMEWSQVDLQGSTWTKPSHHTKQRRMHRVPLPSAAVELLTSLHARRLSTRFVFPGTEGKPLQDVKKTWDSVRQEATLKAWMAQPELAHFGSPAPTTKLAERLILVERYACDLGIQLRSDLRDVRIHDLRHTYASLLISDGASLPMVGALLGHTQAQTTHRYAHLADHALRHVSESAAAKVNTLKQRRD